MERNSLEVMIDQTVFDELLQTAALDLTPSEKIAFRDELNRQMTVIRQLEAIPLDEAAAPVIHGNPYPPEIRCGLRADEWKPFDHPEEIVKQAPESSEGYIVSPDVPHQRIG